MEPEPGKSSSRGRECFLVQFVPFSGQNRAILSLLCLSFKPIRARGRTARANVKVTSVRHGPYMRNADSDDPTAPGSSALAGEGGEGESSESVSSEPEELYESRRLGFVPEEPEFDDEPPGTYLMELRLGKGALVWSILQLVLVVSMTVLGWSWNRDSANAVHSLSFPLEVVWQFLAAGGFLAFLFCFFVRVNQSSESEKQARLASGAVWFHLVALLVWASARWGFGIAFYQSTTGA